MTVRHIPGIGEIPVRVEPQSSLSTASPFTSKSRVNGFTLPQSKRTKSTAKPSARSKAGAMNPTSSNKILETHCYSSDEDIPLLKRPTNTPPYAPCSTGKIKPKGISGIVVKCIMLA